MRGLNTEMDHREILVEVVQGSLEGKNAHLSARQALEDLKLDITGRKILNTPYTIWQLLKHINHWQEKFLERLNGEEVLEEKSWTEGWEETYNACSEEELRAEIDKLLNGIELVHKLALGDELDQPQENSHYRTPYHVVQSMASHLSYHLAEIILLRRIFGAWPPPSGSFVR